MNPMEIEEALIRNRDKAEEAGVRADNVNLVSLAKTIIDAVATAKPTNGLPQAVSITAFTDAGPLPPTFGEWAMGFNLENHRDRYVACAGYCFEGNQPSVNTSDIIELYRKARWDKPQNPADVFTKAAKAGLFTDEDVETPEGELKRWRLTNTGYKYFQSLRKEDEHE